MVRKTRAAKESSMFVDAMIARDSAREGNVAVAAYYMGQYIGMRDALGDEFESLTEQESNCMFHYAYEAWEFVKPYLTMNKEEA